MSQGPHKSFTCPHCRKRFQWVPKIADRKARCPSCDKRIRIPMVPGRVAEAIDPLPESHQPDPQPESDTYDLDLTGIDESIVEAPPTAAQQAAAQTGRCPACNQSINPGAVICIKCGYNLKKGKRLQTSVADGDAPDTPPAPDVTLPGSALASIAASPIAQALQGREDEAGDGRFVNLWLPLILIVLGIGVRLIEQLYFTGNATAGFVAAATYIGVDLVLTIPLLLMAMILAVKILDVAFGPLGQALFKMVAVVLGPAGIGAIITYLIGGLMGEFAGGIVSFCAYWALLSVLFDLEGLEALYLIIIISVLQYVVALFLIGLVLSLIP
jgi:DNA-directed RNA polymerase subunit RPC12/RpoP